MDRGNSQMTQKQKNDACRLFCAFASEKLYFSSWLHYTPDSNKGVMTGMDA